MKTTTIKTIIIATVNNLHMNHQYYQIHVNLIKHRLVALVVVIAAIAIITKFIYFPLSFQLNMVHLLLIVIEDVHQSKQIGYID